MGRQVMILCSVLVMFLMNGCSVFGETIAEECSSELQKVMPCLSYATGKTNTPTKECCGATKEMKESDPKCLCYMMQQTHNGSEQIRSLGIQEGRLLQLPSACQLQNASVSFCPKLLGIPPNSPDAAIFTNVTSTTAPAASTGTSAPDKSANDSAGTKHRPFLPSPLAVAIPVFIYIFTAGSTSMF
ncbi:non-specific lipid transfer protein GPI-anchored 1 [Mercurialis annua]|uniref:non-specific lipid transfer protein GPI-anchored 1 n=1 Tax=Mercurialis annua TaxID=3986 RepID=UPI00215FAA78|nr:non-specific lipid transfer protein GPI-anchored 1 [Mercurialis annua]